MEDWEVTRRPRRFKVMFAGFMLVALSLAGLGGVIKLVLDRREAERNMSPGTIVVPVPVVKFKNGTTAPAGSIPEAELPPERISPLPERFEPSRPRDTRRD